MTARWRAAALGLLACVCVLGGALAQSPARRSDPLLEAVRAELVRQLEKSPRLAKVTVADAATLKAIGQDGVEMTISLDSLLADVRAQPRQQPNLVARFVRTIEATVEQSGAKPEPSRDSVLASMRPVVRSAAYVAQANGGPAGDPTQALLTWPLAGDARVLVALDGAEHVQMVTADIARRQAVTADEVWQRAIANVTPLASTLRLEVRDAFTLLVLDEDYYAAALLLLPSVTARLATALGPDFLVLLADRNTVVAARARDQPALLALGLRIARERKQPPLLPHLLQRAGDGWRVPP
jgi:uncharacterized protein YtpQ (UPF0354 family)